MRCNEAGRASERSEPCEDGFGDERRCVECPVVAGFADAGSVGVVIRRNGNAEVSDIDPLPFHFSCFGHSDSGEEAKGGEWDEFGELFFDDSEGEFGVGSVPCFDGRFLNAREQKCVDLRLGGAHVHGFCPVEEAEDIPAEVVEGFAAESAIGFGEEPMFDIGAGAKGFEITGRVECGGEFLAQEVAGIDIAGSAVV